MLGFESETSLSGLCVEPLVPSCEHSFGRFWKLQLVGYRWKSRSLGLYILSPQFLASLLPVCREVNSLLLHAPTAMLACFSPCPESMEQETGDYRVLNVNQNETFFLLSQVFGHSYHSSDYCIQSR